MANAENVAESFVEFADTLVDTFDLMNFLRLVAVRCSVLLDVTATGILLSEDEAEPEIAAASSGRAGLLELLQVLTGEGPGLACLRTGDLVAVPDLTALTVAARWPRFAHESAGLGYLSVHALPMRLRGEVIGALNLIDDSRGPLTPPTLRMGQALADIASIGLLRARAVRDQRLRADQVRHAVELLRTTARNSEHRLTELGRFAGD